jgi:hypothetical protein
MRFKGAATLAMSLARHQGLTGASANQYCKLCTDTAYGTRHSTRIDLHFQYEAACFKYQLYRVPALLALRAGANSLVSCRTSVCITAAVKV